MEIERAGSRPPAKGPAEWFTGMVRIDAPFKGGDGARVGSATVTFEPGARTAWRMHPPGQTLLVATRVDAVVFTPGSDGLGTAGAEGVDDGGVRDILATRLLSRLRSWGP